MKPYYQHGGITIYHGDCREILEACCRELVKVGMSSSDLDARLTNIQRAIPWQVELIGVSPACNARQLEYQIHIFLADKQVHGEWFDLNEEEIADLIVRVDFRSLTGDFLL